MHLFVQLAQIAGLVAGAQILGEAISNVGCAWFAASVERDRIRNEIVWIRETEATKRHEITARRDIVIENIKRKLAIELRALDLLERELDRQHRTREPLLDTIRTLNRRIANVQTPLVEVQVLLGFVMACHMKLHDESLRVTMLVEQQVNRMIAMSGVSDLKALGWDGGGT